MAKFNEREGNSCHIHLSLRGDDGGRCWPATARTGVPAGEHFLAGQLAACASSRCCFAPNVNSYKRFVPGSFAPTAVAWGVDNRTCAVRVVGHGRRCASRTGCPAGTSTRTSRWRR